MSRYRCVDAQKAAGFPVVAACQAAGASASAFYAWAAKGEQGQRAAEHAQAELVTRSAPSCRVSWHLRVAAGHP